MRSRCARDDKGGSARDDSQRAYPSRSTFAGSLFPARRAGTYIAATLAHTTTSAPIAYTTGSVGLTPYKRPRITRAPASERPKSHQCAGAGEGNAFAQHEPHDLDRAGADRKAHGEFAGAARDRIRDHAIDPHAAEQQGRRGGDGEQQHRQSQTRGRLGDDCVERAHIPDRNARVDRRDGAVNRWSDLGQWLLGPHHEVHASWNVRDVQLLTPRRDLVE